MAATINEVIIMTTNYRDPKAAFASAIEQGLDPDLYMYMYSTEERDYFKHSLTREYVNFPKAEVLRRGGGRVS